ncbi:MAG TPA: helix-turn-helix domain-containing protein [Pirellulales bacterium]|nr:helix-turn-helix domain-containing protein [Pirellulales bacterium]
MKIERTPEQKARIEAIRAQAQRDKPTLEQLVASGEYSDPVPLEDYVELLQTISALRKAREDAGLSLADVAERTGMDRGAISKLETGVHGNPTMTTLQRYAGAVGKQIVVKLIDLPSDPLPVLH